MKPENYPPMASGSEQNIRANLTECLLQRQPQVADAQRYLSDPSLDESEHGCFKTSERTFPG